MPGTYLQLLFHIVFSTKGRMQWITPDVAERLYPFMGGIVRAEKGVLPTTYAAGSGVARVPVFVNVALRDVQKLAAQQIFLPCEPSQLAFQPWRME